MTDFSGILNATRYTGADNRLGANTISMRLAISLVRSLANRMVYDASMMKPGDIDVQSFDELASELEHAAGDLRDAVRLNAKTVFAQAAE